MFNIQGQSASMAYTDSEYIGMYFRVLGAFRKRVLRSAASFTVTATQHNNKVRVEKHQRDASEPKADNDGLGRWSRIDRNRKWRNE